jgi:hypothetical protein
MHTDKNGIVWPDNYPDDKTIKRVLTGIIRSKRETLEEMTAKEREVFLLVRTQHMQRHLLIKKHARSYLAAGSLTKQQIPDELGIGPEFVADIEREPEVHRCHEAGLTDQQMAAQLDMPEERVTRIIKEIKNEEYAAQQVKERLGDAFDRMFDAIWGATSEKNLAQDDGKRTPAPTDPNDEVVFHVGNLGGGAGDAAEAVRFLRQYTNCTSPDSINKLLRKCGVSDQQLRKTQGPQLRVVSGNGADDRRAGDEPDADVDAGNGQGHGEGRDAGDDRRDGDDRDRTNAGMSEEN